MTLGSFPSTSVEQAIERARTAWAKIDNGENPTDTKREEREAATVAELVEKFEEKYLAVRVSKGWANESKRLLRRHVLPTMGRKRVKDIESADVAALLYAMRETPTQANRTRAVVSKMFAWAEKEGLRTSGANPARNQEREEERKKERRLSEAEILWLGRAMRELEPSLDPQAITALRLLLLTGMRRSELLGDFQREIPPLEWEDVDTSAGLIRKAHHKTAKKTRSVRVVHLCKAAVRLLEQHPRIQGCPVIAGETQGRALVNLQNPWKTIQVKVNAMQEEQAIPPKERVSITDVTIHDLRRTFSSVALDLGYPLPFISAILGHSVRTVAEIYARPGADPMRDVAEATGGRIAGLMEGILSLTVTLARK